MAARQTDVVRYAVVGLGHIAQVAVLPAFAHAKRNSRLVALVSDDCILKNRIPEPSGGEGLQDVRIVQALYESAETGKAVRIPPFHRSKRPTGRQRITKPGVKKPTLVKVQSASEN